MLVIYSLNQVRTATEKKNGLGMRLSHYKNLGKLLSQNKALRKAKKKNVAATSLEVFKAGNVDGAGSNVV